jgi:hypothetical protein
VGLWLFNPNHAATVGYVDTRNKWSEVINFNFSLVWAVIGSISVTLLCRRRVCNGFVPDST